MLHIHLFTSSSRFGQVSLNFKSSTRTVITFCSYPSVFRPRGWRRTKQQKFTGIKRKFEAAYCKNRRTSKLPKWANKAFARSCLLRHYPDHVRSDSNEPFTTIFLFPAFMSAFAFAEGISMKRGRSYIPGLTVTWQVVEATVPVSESEHRWKTRDYVRFHYRSAVLVKSRPGVWGSLFCENFECVRGYSSRERKATSWTQERGHS